VIGLHLVHLFRGTIRRRGSSELSTTRPLLLSPLCWMLFYFFPCIKRGLLCGTQKQLLRLPLFSCVYPRHRLCRSLKECCNICAALPRHCQAPCSVVSQEQKGLPTLLPIDEEHPRSREVRKIPSYFVPGQAISITLISGFGNMSERRVLKAPWLKKTL